MSQIQTIPSKKPPFKNYIQKFRYQHTCENARIIFYFGREDQLITRLLKKYPTATAFAHKENEKGHLWFGSDQYFQDVLNRPTPYNERNHAHLSMTLLHEIGHVLGLPHIKNTIMDKNINLLSDFYSTQNLTQSIELLDTKIEKELALELLTKRTNSIDGVNILYAPLDKPLNFKGLYTQKAKQILGLDKKTKKATFQLQKNPASGDKRYADLAGTFKIEFDRNATSGVKVSNGATLDQDNQILAFSPQDLNSTFWGKLYPSPLGFQVPMGLKLSVNNVSSSWRWRRA